MQIWISTHFRVLSEQFPVADENILFIKAAFTTAPVPWSSPFDRFFQLAALQPQVLPFPTAAQQRAASAKVVAMQQVPVKLSVSFENKTRHGVTSEWQLVSASRICDTWDRRYCWRSSGSDVESPGTYAGDTSDAGRVWDGA